MRERPLTFRINRNSPLAKGLVFAALGGGAGTLKCVDASGYNNSGTLTNMDPPTDWVWASDLNRWAWDFLGTSTQSIACVDSPSLDITGTFAVSAWVNSATSQLTAPGIVAKGNAGTGTAYNLNRRYNNASTAAIEAKIGGAWKSKTGSLTAFDGTWHHVLGQYTGAGVELYVDGRIDGSALAATGEVGVSNDVLSIGRHAYVHANALYTGMIADAMVYDRYLSLSEIKMLADPSNVLLSGLIQNPRRKFWPGVLSASTIRRPWQQRRHRRMTGAA